jgi:hypothetical protein
MPQPESPFYQTPDFLLSSILLHFHQHLEGIDRSNPKRLQFCFLRSEALKEILEKFHKKEIRVEPKAFHATQKDLKSRMHQNY